MSGPSQARNFFDAADVDEEIIDQDSGTGTLHDRTRPLGYFLKSRNSLILWNRPDEIEARVQLATHHLTQEGRDGLSVFMLRDANSGMPVNGILPPGQLDHINNEVSRRVASSPEYSGSPKTRDDLDFELATGQSHNWRPQDPNTTYGGDQIPWPSLNITNRSRLAPAAHGNSRDGSGIGRTFDLSQSAQVISLFQDAGNPRESTPNAWRVGGPRASQQSGFYGTININSNGTAEIRSYEDFREMPPAAQQAARQNPMAGLDAWNSLDILFRGLGQSSSSGRRSDQDRHSRRP